MHGLIDVKKAGISPAKTVPFWDITALWAPCSDAHAWQPQNHLQSGVRTDCGSAARDSRAGRLESSGACQGAAATTHICHQMRVGRTADRPAGMATVLPSLQDGALKLFGAFREKSHSELDLRSKLISQIITWQIYLSVHRWKRTCLHPSDSDSAASAKGIACDVVACG